MIKSITSLFLGIGISCLSCFGQATRLTVDNQSPGWLSSKIDYGDQQTVEELTITGYINSDDLAFLGTLMQKQKLTKILDLSDVHIVGSGKIKDDDISFDNIFQLSWEGASLETLKMPTTIIVPTPSVKVRPLRDLTVDTLYYGSTKCNIYNYAIWGYISTSVARSSSKHLILREGVDSIASGACGNENASGSNTPLESVSFPSTLKFIGDWAFQFCKTLQNVDFPENVEEIGVKAFYMSGFNPDTLRVPSKVKNFYTISFNKPSVIILGDNVEKLVNTYGSYNSTGSVTSDYWQEYDKKTIYINTPNPPSISCRYEKFLSQTPVYVPKNSVTLYKNADYWKYAAAILPIPVNVTSVSIKDSETINVGEEKTLSASVIPSNADNPTLIWESSNENIVLVSQEGVIKALASGQATIKAISQENHNIFGECIVTVKQPVSDIIISQSYLEINVGETKQLEVTVLPSNATNKQVKWESNNKNVASVSENGLVRGSSMGEAIITVSAVENESVNTICKVIVKQPVTSVSLNQSSALMKALGETKELIATITPEDASNKNINWTSSNQSVCLVSPRGIVTSTGEGTSVVIATTEDGGFTASCVVTVDLSAGIEGIGCDDNDKIKVINGEVIINNVEPASIVTVYDASGRIVFKGLDRTIRLNNKGIYIVTVEGERSIIAL